MKAGAVEFLTKPFRDQDLLDAVKLALDRDRSRRHQESELAEIKEPDGIAHASRAELLPLVCRARLNKQIAAKIGTMKLL